MVATKTKQKIIITHKWANNSSPGADAEAVWQEIQSLGQKPTKFAIYTHAKLHPESELHKCFTWDDNKASELYRLYEARQLVKSIIEVKTRVTNDEPATIEYRAYEAIPGDGKNKSGPPEYVYVETAKALVDPDIAPKVLAETYKLLAQAKKKIATYKEVIREANDIAERIDDVMKQIELIK